MLSELLVFMKGYSIATVNANKSKPFQTDPCKNRKTKPTQKKTTA